MDYLLKRRLETDLRKRGLSRREAKRSVHALAELWADVVDHQESLKNLSELSLSDRCVDKNSELVRGA